MAKMYANLIIHGRKTIDDVPSKLKEAVEAILIENGFYNNNENEGDEN